MAWSPEKRRQFLRELNEVEKGVGTFYKYFLYALIIGVTLFTFYLYQSFDKGNRPFLEFYFGVLYLLFLLWAGVQLFGLRRRFDSNLSPLDQPAPKPFELKFDRDPKTGARKLFFRFGTSAATSKTARFNFGVNLSSLAEEDKPDDSALAQAEGYLEAGTTLDMICRLLNPRYSEWSPPQQEIYRVYINGAVELRKAKNPQFTDSLWQPEPPPVAPEQAVQSPLPTASVPDAFDSDVKKSWLTPAQMIAVAIIAGIVLGALITTLWLSRALNQ